MISKLMLDTPSLLRWLEHSDKSGSQDKSCALHHQVQSLRAAD